MSFLSFKFWDLLKALLPKSAAPVQSKQQPMPIVTAIDSNTIVPKSATRGNLCLGLRDYEGSPGKGAPADRNYRNNNPGNCRYSSVGYLPIYGNVREDREGVPDDQPGFAIFKDYATGWKYLNNLVKEKIEKHPAWTLLLFIGDEKEGWSPASDGNEPVRYSAFLGRRLGVDSATFPIGKLLIT